MYYFGNLLHLLCICLNSGAEAPLLSSPAPLCVFLPALMLCPTQGGWPIAAFADPFPHTLVHFPFPSASVSGWRNTETPGLGFKQGTPGFLCRSSGAPWASCSLQSECSPYYLGEGSGSQNTPLNRLPPAYELRHTNNL